MPDPTPTTTAPAVLIDRVHADWSMMLPLAGRPTFATYLVDRLERAGYTLRPSCLEEVLAAAQVRPTDLYPLNVPVPDLPHWNVAVGMSVGEVADLLAALDERGLRWRPGIGGPNAERGTLDDGCEGGIR